MLNSRKPSSGYRRSWFRCFLACWMIFVMTGCSNDEEGGNKGIVIASHLASTQPPGLDSAAEAFGTSVTRSNTADMYESFAAFSSGSASVALLAGPALDLAMTELPGAKAISPINTEDTGDHVLLIASRDARVERAGDNLDFNTTRFPGGLEDLRFAFGPDDTISNDIATFGIRALKDTTINRFFTQRTVQMDNFQDVIDAISRGDVDVGVTSESAYNQAVAEKPVLAFSARIVWRGPTTTRWVIQADLDEQFGAGTTDKITQLLHGDLLIVPAG